jgi:NDP-sugar pyrophosphorylase family protein
MRAVILAGGKGTRLAPYTAVLPKPLMPIGEMPILEIVIRQLAHHQIRDITLAVLLMAYCGDGGKFGVKLNYSREEQPLGTAGPISLIRDLNETFLVMNGDLLTSIDYGQMWNYHKERKAIATLASYHREVKIDLGVIESEDGWVKDYIEKPTYHYAVSTGIYIFEPEVLKFIEHGQRLDLPELVLRMIRAREKVNIFNFAGYWLDIGRHDDYDAAVQKFAERRSEFLANI